MTLNHILDKKLPLEISLPSSRELARHLGIARNTVVLAYQQLIDEGNLISRERSGYYIDQTFLGGRVNHHQASEKLNDVQPDWNKHIKTLVADHQSINGVNLEGSDVMRFEKTICTSLSQMAEQVRVWHTHFM